jgi:hypothetical protein
MGSRIVQAVIIWILVLGGGAMLLAGYTLSGAVAIGAGLMAALRLFGAR